MEVTAYQQITKVRILRIFLSISKGLRKYEANIKLCH